MVTACLFEVIFCFVCVLGETFLCDVHFVSEETSLCLFLPTGYVYDFHPSDEVGKSYTYPVGFFGCKRES